MRLKQCHIYCSSFFPLFCWCHWQELTKTEKRSGRGGKLHAQGQCFFFFLSSSGKIKSKKSNLCHKAPSTCGIFTPLKGVSSLLLTSAQVLASHLCLPSWLGCKCEELPVTLTRRNSLLFQIGFFTCWENGGKAKGLSSRCMGFSSCSTLGVPTQEENVQELCQGTLLCQGSQQTLFTLALHFSCA